MSTKKIIDRADQAVQEIRDVDSQLRQISRHLFGEVAPSRGNASPSVNQPRASALLPALDEIEDQRIEAYADLCNELNYIMARLGMVETPSAPAKPFIGKAMPRASDPEGYSTPRPFSPQEQRERMRDKHIDEVLGAIKPSDLTDPL
jgi:hypothetical protein